MQKLDSDLIKRLMAEGNIKQVDIMRQTGASRATVHKWVNGSIPSGPNYIKLLNILGLSDYNQEPDNTAQLPGDVLDKRMNALGVTNAELARQIGAGRMNVGNWRLGRSTPSGIYYERIMNALELTYDAQGKIVPIEQVSRNIQACRQLSRVRILNEFQAGHPENINEDDALEHILVENDLIKNGHPFALKVTGDSMYKEGHRKSLAEGEYVVVDTTNKDPNPGDVVVALWDDGRATIKLYSTDMGSPMLVPLNDRYPIINQTSKPASECHIVGIVTGVVPPVRKFI